MLRNKYVLQVALAALALAVLFVWSILAAAYREPVYQGKTVREWLSRLDQASRPIPFDRSVDSLQRLHDATAAERRFNEATEALRQMGTNAVPTLLRMIRARDSTWSLRGKAWLRELGFTGAHLKPGWLQHEEAERGFAALGSQAQCAVPAMIRVYEEGLSEESQVAVIHALTSVDRETKSSVPFLLRALARTNTAAKVRCEIIHAVNGVHGDPVQVVPALQLALTDGQWEVRGSAAAVLGDYGTNARPAVPALLLGMDDPYASVVTEIRHALVRIDPEAATKAGISVRFE